MTDDEKARAEQARRLREGIDQPAKRKSPGKPRSPHEFIEERMRKLAEEEKRKEGDDDLGEPSP